MISGILKLGNGRATCWLLAKVEMPPARPKGIIKYPVLFKRLAITTTSALKKLNVDETLLERLNSHLLRTGSINDQLLQESGFVVYIAGNQQFFGIHLPDQKEKDIFLKAVDSLSKPGKNAEAFFKLAGIETSGVSSLNEEELNNLGKQVRTAFNSGNTNEITIADDHPLTVISGSKIKIAKSSLKPR